MAHQPLLILAAPRTGTHLLRSLLHQDPNVVDLSEVFNPQLAHHRGLGFWAPANRQLSRALGDGTDADERSGILKLYLRGLLEAFPGRTVLCDLKYNQIPPLDTMWRNPDETPAALRVFLEANASVLHVSRRNLLAQLCSLRLVLETGKWVHHGAAGVDEQIRPRRIPLSTTSLIDDLDRLRLRKQIADAWLGSYPRVVNVEYEEILKGDRLAPEVAAAVASLVGRELVVQGPAGTKKIAPELPELIENFDEVRQILRGTDYEFCLRSIPDAKLPRVPPKAYPSRIAGSENANRSLAGKTVLVGLEVAADSFLLLALSEVADAIRRAGGKVVVAASERGSGLAVGGPAAIVLQAPVWPPHTRSGRPLRFEYQTDFLAAIGFEDSNRLRAMVQTWDGIIQFVRPHVTLAVQSPALLLNRFGSGSPTISVGTALFMPPLEYQALPLLETGVAATLPESTFLSAAQRVQLHRGAPVPEQLRNIFRADGQVVFGLAEIDPYRSFRRTSLSAPPGGLPRPAGIPPGRPRVLVVLGPDHPAFRKLRDGLMKCDVPFEVSIDGAFLGEWEMLRTRGREVSCAPSDAKLMLKQCSHVISAGSALLSAAAYAAGRPHFIVPRDVDGELTGRLVEKEGMGCHFPANAGADTLRLGLTAFLTDRSLRDRAFEKARRISLRQQPDGLDAVRNLLDQVCSNDAPADRLTSAAATAQPS